jgi:hypothetical protein
MRIGTGGQRGWPIPPFAGPAHARLTYSSSMCSSDLDPDLATRLGSAIEELAAAATAADQPAERDVVTRLAAAWALITEADPELAERTARYSV